ncbi:MAG: ribonuclease HII [Paludibacteraceae bacterium]|nr:ribonuclease HII [Paludibacteraceae bacterium]MBQ9705433.1 ribonuclease HII [Paludibacteraceae bacterium]
MLLSCMYSGIPEAGCDEAGRGPLAGSVFAAAVVLPDGFADERLNDSKQLTEHERNILRPVIEQQALAWAVAEVTAEEIDRINILNASILAMHRALDRLPVRPQHILVDGNRFRPYMPDGSLAIPHHTVVKGDGKYMSIAAASILAKTWRDEYMRRLARQYPLYGWDHNMGYPTAEHRRAILRYGLTPFHRKTFTFKTDDL